LDPTCSRFCLGPFQRITLDNLITQDGGDVRFVYIDLDNASQLASYDQKLWMKPRQ